MSHPYIKEIAGKGRDWLPYLVINLDSEKKDKPFKNLILTGKNGSGKSSFLSLIRDYLDLFYNSRIDTLTNQRNLIETILRNHNNRVVRVGRDPSNDSLQTVSLKNFSNLTRENFDNVQRALERIKQISPLDISQDLGSITRKIANKQFVMSYFDAKRTVAHKVPQGINKIEFNKRRDVSNKINNFFLQYLVNLKAERSFARDDEDHDTVAKIDKWFNLISINLAELLGEPGFDLHFDRKEFTYYVSSDTKPRFKLTDMSDGHTAIISIVAEIILQIEGGSDIKLYHDTQGIVLIDEIETHLHIDLQKKILPALESFFPNIQFIVTTHSPFVLSSSSNSVVCDLENGIIVSDLTGYSYDTLVESYFRSSKYSQEVKDKLAEFERLSLSGNSDGDRYDDLYKFFDGLPKYYMPELDMKVKDIVLSYKKNRFREE